MGAWRLKFDVGQDSLVLKGQDRLDERGKARCALGMADVGLNSQLVYRN